MRVRFFGGFEVEVDGAPVAVRGRGQEALLFRLAIDAGTTVGYRALAEDVWPDDPPDDPRAALQSLASRLRRSLPANTLEAAPGGYRLAIARDDVDVTRFQDLAAAAGQQGDDTLQAARLARTALGLWTGEPWTPAGFDWVVRDLLEDRARCERLVRDAAASAEAHATSHLPEIPAALTSLVGRRRELDLIASQLEAERLVTLIGPGGAGKTTLAMESARRHLHAVAVELAPASPGEVWAAVAGAVARSIRVTDAPSTPAGPRERALEALAGRTSLIVLDNCEHVSREAAEVAADLLGTLSGTRILATSREPLGVPGEAFVALGPLPDADAVELFSHRVRAARGTPPADGESDAVDRIVRRLDGLPLALELAAAKTRTLSIAEIDAGLDDRFTLLATGPRAADPRHQTLRALIDWSWETLTGSERTALLTLAVFPDGIDAVDAPLIAREFETDAASFDQLVDRSLLHRTDGRFRMLETVREYGLDRLQADGEEARFRAREARAMAALAIARDPLLRGPEVRRALQWFDVNDENLTSALRTCETDPELIGTGVLLVRARLWEGLMRERFDELMGGLTRFTDLDGPLDSEAAVVATGVRVFVDVFGAIAGAARDDADALSPDRFGERADRITRAAQRHPSELALALPPVLKGARAAMDAWAAGTPWWSVSLVIGDEGLADAPVWTRAFISVMRSALAQNGGDVETLGRESERALAMFRELGDVWGVAMASQMRSEWLMIQGRLDEALAVADASTAGLTGLTSVWDVIQQRSLGISVLMRLGRLDEARERLRDIRALAESEGSERAIFQAELTAAALDVAAGDGAAALARLDAVGDIRLPGPPDQILAWASTKRAQALLLLGRPDEARDALRAALATAGRSGDQPIQADVVVALAMWLADVGRPDDARRALAASVRIRGAVDDSEPMFAALLARLEAPGFELEAPARPEQSANLDELAALLD